MSYQEWETWFKGSEVFNTPRNTRDFELIQNGFEASKVLRNVLLISEKYKK